MATKTSKPAKTAKPVRKGLTKKEEALLELLAAVAGASGQDEAYDTFVARYKGTKHV